MVQQCALWLCVGLAFATATERFALRRDSVTVRPDDQVANQATGPCSIPLPNALGPRSRGFPRKTLPPSKWRGPRPPASLRRVNAGQFVPVPLDGVPVPAPACGE
jgi:hypothetical protein